MYLMKLELGEFDTDCSSKRVILSVRAFVHGCECNFVYVRVSKGAYVAVGSCVMRSLG